MVSDIDSWLAVCRDGGLLGERQLRILCEKAKEIFIDESNVQPVSAPVTVVGNISGKFHDLVKVFELNGEVPDKRYLIIGSFVGRHYTSMETFSLLLCLKVKYPGSITMVRSSHEDRAWTEVYGF